MKIFVLSLSLLLGAYASAQQRPTGMIFDPPSLRTIPYKAKLTTDSYQAMPASASLEKYCPTPGDQGQYGTCVAFATAYHLRTILYNKLQSEMAHGSMANINTNAAIFSPTFVYEQIKNSSDHNCKEGANPVDAFILMKKSGAAKISTVPYSCGASIRPDAKQEGLNFRITDYQILYSVDETDADLKIKATKKAISEGYPCALGFIVAKSFYNPGGVVWREASTDNGPTGQHGRHAMCVVGYDDNKYGGAFRVLNSWGTNWADKGFVWIPYKEFARYSMMVIQAYGPAAPKPQPGPAKPDEPVLDVLLKGRVAFQMNTGESMTAVKVAGNNLDAGNKSTTGEELVAYKMDKAYASGTRFRFMITTSTECFLYAFATDLSGKVNKILPFADNMSPHIGSNSTVAFPSETKVVKMDDNPGTDYLLILYAQQRLNADELLSTLNKLPGGFTQKIKKALGDQLILPASINYHPNDIGFDLKKGHQGTVVPLMVEIKHQ